MNRGARFATCLAGLVLLGVVNPAVAMADPAGPTDYLSEVTEVEPGTDGIALRMLGGDSFLELEVDAGIDVVVIGYRGENYLWFSPDGTVYENDLSPSRYLNEDRYGELDIPAHADPEAEPQWREVGTGGRFAWHDHRTHWMNRARPPGAEPGDTILEAVIPLVVDGEEVAVTVQSVWQAAPSPVGAIIGAIIAVALVAGLALKAGRPTAAALATLLVAIAALGIGAWQVLSLPSETGPSAMLWLLPLISLLCAGCAVLSIRSDMWDDLSSGLTLLAALLLASWAVFRFEGVSRAIIPTDAPFLLDRAVTVAAVIVGLSALGLAGYDFSRRLMSPTPTRPAVD